MRRIPHTQHRLLLDPITTDWMCRVVDNGGAAPSPKTVLALNDFVIRLRQTGLLSKMYMVNPVVPDSLTAAMTPLIYTPGGATPTELCNGSFETGYTGWSSNGATLSIQSGGKVGNYLRVSHYPGAYPYIYWTLSATVNKRYRLRLWFKNLGSRGQIKIGTTVNGTEIYNGPIMTETDWALKLVHFTATASTVYVTLYNVDAGTAASGWDEVSLAEVACDEIWTNVNYVADDLNVHGIKGYGKYAKTGHIPSGSTVYSDGGLTVYCYSGESQTSWQTQLGGGSPYHILRPVSGASGAHTELWSWGTGHTSLNTAFLGYSSMSQIGTTYYLYGARSDFNHALRNSGTGGTSVCYRELYAMALNANDVATQVAANRCSFFAAHKALTESNSATFYQLVQTLRQNLGGGYL